MEVPFSPMHVYTSIVENSADFGLGSNQVTFRDTSPVENTDLSPGPDCLAGPIFGVNPPTDGQAKACTCKSNSRPASDFRFDHLEPSPTARSNVSKTGRCLQRLQNIVGIIEHH